MGNFFGINNDWHHTSTNITFHRKDEIKEFKEKEYEGTCVTEQGNIANKHWHIFEVIAIKA